MWKNLFSSMPEILLDSLFDSLKVFALVFVINLLISFVEDKLVKHLQKGSKLAPLYGASCGLIPQCGISVVASDLYLKKHITMGTLIAVFLACSDEALPIMLAGGNHSALMTIPLIISKLIVGFVAGIVIDSILKKKNNDVKLHLATCDNNDETVQVGCCNHDINNEKENKWHKHLVHPLLHSLKLFIYVLIINIIFGCLISLITEVKIISFLESNKYLSPLFCVLIGLIPNCAASVLISELYVLKALSFGATLAGLCVNAGLGLVFLFKSKNRIKNNFIILFTLFLISVFVGYAFCLFLGF